MQSKKVFWVLCKYYNSSFKVEDKYKFEYQYIDKLKTITLVFTGNVSDTLQGNASKHDQPGTHSYPTEVFFCVAINFNHRHSGVLMKVSDS